MSKINGSKIEYASIEKIPLDLECYYDINIAGKGMRLTNVESFDKKHQKNYHGLQSEFFGSDFSSDEAFKERYRCNCGRYMGKSHNGDYCKLCDSYVQYHDIDLTKTGWVIIDHFEVISPIYGAKLVEALGKIDNDSVFKYIIARKYEEKGKNEFSDKELQILEKHPFSFKGFIWLREHLPEVLNYYRKKKPSKAKLFDELESEQDLIWTHCLPIYTSFLRSELPGEKGSNNFQLKINTYFRSIIKTSNAINKICEENILDNNLDLSYEQLNTIDIFLFSIQKEVSKVFETVYNDLTDKTGIITAKVLGGRYNFSSRDIIVPNNSTLRSDQIIMGYIPFMELFRYELQNEYRKVTGCTPNKANMMWKKAISRFDDMYYAIIQHMLSNPEYSNHLGCIVNRNPSINYGSFIYMKVAGVKKDLNDKTLEIPVQVIRPMNADFDGDVINVFRIIGMDLQRRFEKNLNPRYNLFISRANGKANKETIPVKDNLVAFWAFNNM